MKNDECPNYIRKTITIDRELYPILEEMAKKDGRTFSGWAAMQFKKIAENSHE